VLRKAAPGNARVKEDRSMTVTFPNQSRSYDATRNAVRFWGHNRAMETSFFIAAEALRRLEPGAGNDEASLLKAFDAHRDAICAAAAKRYARGSRGSYDLEAGDFAQRPRAE
jgi:hypothetical protein